jgi:hypothetical protein
LSRFPEFDFHHSTLSGFFDEVRICAGQFAAARFAVGSQREPHGQTHCERDYRALDQD